MNTSEGYVADSTTLGLGFVNASGDSGGCVDVARDADGYVWMRNSNNIHGPAIRYTPTEWAHFLQGAKTGHFDGI